MKDAIKAAAKKLDHASNADWQEDGRPSLKRIHQLAGTVAITQEQLDDALPDLRREKQTPVDQNAAKVAAAKVEADKAAAASKNDTAPAPAKLSPAKATVASPEVERIKKASGIGKDAVDVPSDEQPFLEGVLVVATEQGYFGSKLREPGETFYFTGRKGRWMDIAKAEDRKLYARERAASAAGDDSDANRDPTDKSL